MRLLLIITGVVLFLLQEVENSPITIPLTPEGDIGSAIPDYYDTKRGKSYHLREPLPISQQTTTVYDLDLTLHGTCGLDFSLQWVAQSGAPIVASPVISSISPRTGWKTIFTSTRGVYVDNLRGSDGGHPPGWPITLEGSESQASPLVHDVDGDGNVDVGVVDTDASLHWLKTKDFGAYLEDFHVQIPKLRVRRDWVDAVSGTSSGGRGRNADQTMLSMFDRHTVNNEEDHNKMKAKVRLDPLSTHAIEDAKKKKRKEEEDHELNGKTDSGGRRLSEEDGEDHRGEGEEGEEMFHIDHGEEDPDARFNMDFSKHNFNEFMGNGDEGGAPQGMEDGAPYSYGANMVGHTDDGIGYYMNRRYGDFEWTDEKFLAVDAHVLATPAMGDINKDGHMEIVFPVSYYFDPAAYANKEVDFDPSQFVASALVCWDMQAQEWAWTVHLDLSTTKSKRIAAVYSSPTLADLDGDGRLEVIVGTSMGLLYVVDGESGFVRRFFPMQFASITAQIAVGDVIPETPRGTAEGDKEVLPRGVSGKGLEMVVVDMAGTIALVSVEGDVVWDTQIAGECPFAATMADVDSDGQTDIVVVSLVHREPRGGRGGTASIKSLVWALDGATGAVLDGYPIGLPGGATASASLSIADLDAPGDSEGEGETPVRRAASRRGSAHLLIPSLDGFVYVVKTKPRKQPNREDDKNQPNGGRDRESRQTVPGAAQCLQRIDAGAALASAVLVDDVDSDGVLDLVVSTLAGETLVYGTNAPTHSANIWSSFPRTHGRSFTAGDLSISVAYGEKERLKEFDLKSGQNLSLAFDLAHYRGGVGSASDSASVPSCAVIISRGANPQDIVWEESLSPCEGRHLASFPIASPEQAVFVLTARTDEGLVAEETVAVTVGTRFYVWIKYFVIAPVAVFSVITMSKLVSLR